MNTRNSTIIMNLLGTLFSLLTVANSQSWYDCVPGITGSIGGKIFSIPLQINQVKRSDPHVNERVLPKYLLAMSQDGGRENFFYSNCSEDLSR